MFRARAADYRFATGGETIADMKAVKARKDKASTLKIDTADGASEGCKEHLLVA